MKYVYIYGTYDLLHPGHIAFIKAAKKLGDILHIGIVSDKAVKELKGEGRPVQSQADRMRMVEAIKGVSQVHEQPTYDPTLWLDWIRDCQIGTDMGESSITLCKGDDWDDIPGKDWDSEGVEFNYVSLPYSKEWSTSKTIVKIIEEYDRFIPKKEVI